MTTQQWTCECGHSVTAHNGSVGRCVAMVGRSRCPCREYRKHRGEADTPRRNLSDAQSNTAANSEECERLRAELARVTAERDEASERARRAEADRDSWRRRWGEEHASGNAAADALRARVSDLDSELARHRELWAHVCHRLKVSDGTDKEGALDAALEAQAAGVRNAALEEAATPLAGQGVHVMVNAQAEADRIRALKTGGA